jgi:hypothetical protein
MRFFKSFVCAAVLASSPAAAATVTIQAGDNTVEVALPEGYCALDEKLEGHKKILDFARGQSQGQNDVLVISGPCAETEELGAGKISALATSFLVLAPTQAKGLDLTGQESKSLTGVCQDLKRASGGGSSEPDLGRLEAQVAAVLDNLKSGDLVPIGLYREGAGYCMNGFAMKRDGADGKPRPSVILSGMSVWKGLLVQVLQTIVYKERLFLQRDVEALEGILISPGVPQ